MLSEYYPIWMALGDGFRARRLADRAHERYRAAGWAAAEAEGFVLTNYQTRNVAEFFAVAYEDYLCNLYSLPSAREAGFEHLEPVFAFIDGLSA
jgi:hypothetical protein